MTCENPPIDVPSHILDMVVDRACAYIETNKDRMLTGIPEHQHEAILKNSTHNIVHTPERRALHRLILQEMAQNVTPQSLTDKPTLIYVSGPPAVGKSTLLKYFDNRVENTEIGAHENETFESAFQCYAAAKKGNYMAPDFQVFKKRLPEFEAFGNQFAIIRAEASALEQATQVWAKELKTNVVLEQVDDGDLKQWASKKMEDHKLISIKLTVAPAVNVQRLKERNQKTGQVIPIEELDSYIEGVSAGGMNALRGLVDKAYLFSSGDEGYKTIYMYEDGEEIVSDPKALAVFESYAEQANSLEGGVLEKGAKPRPV